MAIVKKNIGKDQKTYFSIIEKKGFKRTKNEKIATTTIRLFFPASWIDKSASGTEYIPLWFDQIKWFCLYYERQQGRKTRCIVY